MPVGCCSPAPGQDFTRIVGIVQVKKIKFNFDIFLWDSQDGIWLSKAQKRLVRIDNLTMGAQASTIFLSNIVCLFDRDAVAIYSLLSA